MKTNDYEQSQEKKPILVYSKLSTVIHIVGELLFPTREGTFGRGYVVGRE